MSLVAYIQLHSNISFLVLVCLDSPVTVLAHLFSNIWIFLNSDPGSPPHMGIKYNILLMISLFASSNQLFLGMFGAMNLSAPICNLIPGRTAFSPISKWCFHDISKFKFIPSSLQESLAMITFSVPSGLVINSCGGTSYSGLFLSDHDF